ncbi:MAG: hypothetical protein ACXVP8_08445 [Actinomycetota bacterium]
MTARRTGSIVAMLTLLAGLLAANPALGKAQKTWLAGAAAEKITPLAFDPARDLVEFPDATCPRAVYSGARVFDHEEPYADANQDGTFTYGQDLPCDANHNGRWDGLYSSGGVDHLTEWVHDDIWARAVAISDGTRTVVMESVTSQGLFIEDDLRIRNGIRAQRPQVTQTYVSSTHNESSPDPIGIYGAPDDGTGSAGVFSGVDDYYISYLVAQAIKAGVEAVDAMTPAKMRIVEFTPTDVRARLSDTFPTTDSIKNGTPPFGTPEATDTKARVLQLVRADNGANIETIFNFAAHNQELGHAPDTSVFNGLRVNRAVSDDWPGVFAQTVEQHLGGHAMFMVADNGSIEDPHPVPLVQDCPQIHSDEGCFELPAHTGALLADDVVRALAGSTEQIAPHPITAMTEQFNVPLQNQLFIAAFASGLFAHRTTATVSPCLDATSIPRTCFLTEVGLLDFGPQLQMLVNPGEAYPALIEGDPFGVEQMACPDRAEPPAPAWHARAEHKLEMGLGNDMIGYEIPSPAWFADPAVVVDPTCPLGAQFQSDPSADYDRNDQYHKLESESAGQDAGNLVASHMAALADQAGGATASTISSGRFLMSDGSFTRKGADGPVGMWILPEGTSSFAPGTGIIVALSGIAGFGSARVTCHGVFMDFDGRAQNAPDIDTRGMLVMGPHGKVTRYFLDPYAVLGGSAPGAAH